VGWWKTGTGDDIAGDGPADAIQTALAIIAELAVEKDWSKPTLEQLLAAIVGALNREKATWVQGGSSVLALEARLGTGAVRVTDKDTVDGDLAKTIGRAFWAVAQEYDDVLDRKPRLSELLYTVRFILAPEPDYYLSIDPQVTIENIEAELAPERQIRKREALMKDELLDGYVQFYRARIAQYEAQACDPVSSSSDHALMRDVIAQNKLWLFIARYSRGDSLATLEDAFPTLIDSLAACEFESVPNSVNFSYLEGYVRALWLVSLALLFEVRDDLFRRLLDLIGQTGQDALYDRLVALRVSATSVPAPLLYPDPYRSLYLALDADEARRDELVDQFLKQFYAGMQDTYWHDLHLKKEKMFFGYWCFTLAAFVKCKDWSDVSFAANYFYPRDLAGRRLFRTWADSEAGEADRLAYQQLKELRETS
jgi:hypothetical protein